MEAKSKSEEIKLASVETQTSHEYTASSSLHAATDVESSTFEELNVTLPFTPKIIEIQPRSKQVPPVNSIIAELINYPLPKRIHHKTVQHIDQILRALNRKKINLLVLKSLAFKGIPTQIPPLRAVVWKILLNYLPLETGSWDQYLAENKQLYLNYQKDLIIKPDLQKLQSQKHPTDHPLSISDNSEWNLFFKDQELMECVEKDVKRTRTEMEFFVGAIDTFQNQNKEQLFKQSELRLSELSTQDKANYIETHADVLLRLLFLFGKLNKGISYVQGMNEIIAVVYYCFFQAESQKLEEATAEEGDNNRLAKIKEEYLNQIEADTFFCFTHLFGEIRDRFCRTLDNTQDGLNGSIHRVSSLIEDLDPELFAHIKAHQVLPHYYLLKWTMLLVSQQLNMPDVCQLWDSLFSDPNRFLFLDYVCVAMVRSVRQAALDTDDFIDLMPVLQDIKIEDIGAIIADAVKLSKKSPLYRDFAQEPHFRAEEPVKTKKAQKKQDSMSFLLRAVTNVKNSLKKKLKGKNKTTLK